MTTLINYCKELRKIFINYILTCKKCKRLLPNKQSKTKRGCIWCDKEFYE